MAYHTTSEIIVAVFAFEQTALTKKLNVMLDMVYDSSTTSKHSLFECSKMAVVPPNIGHCDLPEYLDV